METIFAAGADSWAAVLQIVAIDILLAGDNAVVIALACRNLPPELRRRGLLWGVAGAIALRVALTAVAISLLDVPWLKAAGAALVFWIGVKLVLPEAARPEREVEASQRLAVAIRTVIVADAVISFDNVIAVAAAAQGSVALVAFGLALSIPIVVWASGFVLALAQRHPAVVLAGGGLIGWVALDLAVADAALRPWIEANAAWLRFAAPPAGAAAVVAAGLAAARRRDADPTS